MNDHSFLSYTFFCFLSRLPFHFSTAAVIKRLHSKIAYILRTKPLFEGLSRPCLACSSLYWFDRKVQDFQWVLTYWIVLFCTRRILAETSPWRLVRMRSPVRIWLASPVKSRNHLVSGLFCFFRYRILIHFEMILGQYTS